MLQKLPVSSKAEQEVSARQSVQLWRRRLLGLIALIIAAAALLMFTAPGLRVLEVFGVRAPECTQARLLNTLGFDVPQCTCGNCSLPPQ